MRLEFRPFIGLTLITSLMLAFLLALGTWQYQRLQWKTGLIADIKTAANASPLRSLEEINALLAQNQPVDFRRVSLRGNFVNLKDGLGQGFHMIRPYEKTLAWQLFQPFLVEDTGLVGSQGVYIATHYFEQSAKHAPPEGMIGPALVNGYIRLPHQANRFTPQNTPAANRWFVFNGAPDVLNWAGGVQGAALQTGYYIELAPGAPRAEALAVRIPDIRNSHLEYMLTWYSFAFVLLIIYFILHAKQGRLRLNKESR